MDNKNKNQKTQEANIKAPAAQSPSRPSVGEPFFFAPSYAHPPSYGPRLLPSYPEYTNPIWPLPSYPECTSPIWPLPSYQESSEEKRSPSLISTDESDDDDYIAPDMESETESEFSQEQDGNRSPVPSTDESDSDYSAPDTDSIPDTASIHDTVSIPDTESEPSQEQIRDMSTPEPDLYSPPTPSWNDLGPRHDDKLYGDLFGLVPASSLGPPPPSPRNPITSLRERAMNWSPSPSDNESLSKALDKAIEEQQRAQQAVASAKPGLSQDLEKKMLSSLSAYELNIEKLGKEIRDRCDRISERFDRLEKEKRDRRDNTIPRPYKEMAEIMFPGRSIYDLTDDECQEVRVERLRRLEKAHLERLANCRKAIAGPSREQMVSPSPNLEEIIRQEREKIRELERARHTAAALWKGYSDPRTRLPSPKRNHTVSQSLETSEKQSRERIDAPVVTANQKKKRKSPVFDDDLSEMIDRRRRSEERKKKGSQTFNPNDALGMSAKETRERIDRLLSDASQDEEKDALPDYERVMDLEKDLCESLDSLPPRPSSSRGQERKRSTASDHIKSVFENFEEMRKHVREFVEQEKKRRKTNDLSFQECMNDLYPADSEIWKIDDEPLQVKSLKPVESQSDKDLGNDRPLSFDEYLDQGVGGAIDDLNGSAPFADNPALLTISPIYTTYAIPPMTPFPTMPLMPLIPMPRFPTTPAMPNASSLDIEPKTYQITRPASLSLPQSMACYYAFPFGSTDNHTPWLPETEVLEAVSDKPFSEWVDITGVREFIHDELSCVARRKVTIEACRVKGEENARLMAFILMEEDSWPVSASLYDLSISLESISDKLSSMGINDVKVEFWETDFLLMPV